jgi:hypothetical protein
MHVAYLSAAAAALALPAGVFSPRLGRSFPQTSRAPWYAGGGRLSLLVQLGRPFDPSVGSGKSLTPCERMHAENFTATAISDADALALEQPEGEQPEIDEALGDPPPHATNPIPRATTAASVPARRRRGSMPTTIHR